MSNDIRLGDWAQTWSGGKWWPLDPRPDDIRIVDIAHALSMICRFNGHLKWFYSVAQHSVMVSYIVRPELAFIGLLHDSAEAYLGDMVRPLKLGMPEYKAIERLWEQAIDTYFGLDGLLVDMPEEVKRADRIALATERRDLLTPGPGWDRAWATVAPLPGPIVPFESADAEREFMRRFNEVRPR